MKTILSVMFIAILTITINCGQAQENASEKKVQDMLVDFYTRLFYIYENDSITSSVPADVRHEKIDSLLGIYCSSRLRDKAKEILEDGYGHDILTNNLVGELNENLKVEKEAGKENSYIVSFLVTYSDAPRGSLPKQVLLHVNVVKEEECYKIDSVR